MTQREVKGKEYLCDGCGKSVVEMYDEPVLGFHGDATEISGAGGQGGSWFACRRTCIQNAVVNAVRGTTPHGLHQNDRDFVG